MKAMNAAKRCSQFANRHPGFARWRDRWQGEEIVFGKPEWFTKKRLGWGIAPVRLPGWVYTAVWSLVIVTPFALLLLRHRAPEAAIWLVGSIGMLTWDVRKLMRGLDRTVHSVHDSLPAGRRELP